MMKRGVKIGLIIGAILLLVVLVSLVVYFNFFAKTTYHIVGVEKTTHQAADFKANSELKFYKNGTFHVRIEHDDIGLVLTGIGTYTLKDKTYELKFDKIYARNTEDTVVDITGQCDAITCKRYGNRIQFTDHNSQIYYFG